jgi:transcriptional regulator with GAF, ATPase, and Fis domain
MIARCQTLKSPQPPRLPSAEPGDDVACSDHARPASQPSPAPGTAFDGTDVISPVSRTVLEDKLRDIQAITDAALSRLDDHELLAKLLQRTRAILQADTAAVLLLDFSSGQLIATAAAGLEEEVRQGVLIPVGQGFAGRIAAERRPVLLDRVTPRC